jgi:hypothetical protein
VSDPANIFRPLKPDDYNLLTVAVFDTAKGTPGPANTVSVLSSYASTVFSTASHLYVVMPDWGNYTSDSTSTLVQFALDGTNVDLAATGSVPGQVLNQFSMDEQGAYFRIVTTSNWGSSQTSSLFVLTAHGQALDVIGSLTGIAPGDQLHATRFVGDTAFIVTARFIDPLFAVNLSDPTAPVLVGELHIPGASSYLQPIDATHLLAIGRDGPEGSALKLELFDDSDLANLREVDQYVISPPNWSWWWGSGSEAEWDHHAFSYFPEYQTLAIPVYGSYNWGNLFASDAYNAFQSSLWVFKVDPATGFQLEGTIAHDSQVRRSVRIGDQLYSIADNSVQMHPIDNPNASAVDVRITDLPRFPNYGPLTAVAGVAFSGNVLEFKVTDATGLTATINWGDGQTSDAVLSADPDSADHFFVSGSHTYAVRGNYSVTVTFTRDGTDAGTLWNWANVSGPDDPRNIAFASILPFVDQPFSGQVLTFDVTDANGLAATITWGDGDYSSGAITPTADGHYTVSGSHTYDVGGSYYVSVSFTRNGETLANPWTYVDVAPLGPEDQHFLNQTYLDLLHRTIDPGSVTYWGEQFRHGVARAQIAQQIADSAEGRANMIGGLYQRILGRNADGAGEQYWANFLAAGHSENDLMVALLGSGEFAANHGGSTAGFLTAVYQDVLHRDVDAAGLDFWSRQLAAGLSHQDLALAVLHSQEAALVTVRDSYTQYLRRAADDGGLHYFANNLLQGQPPEQLAVMLIGSTEYYGLNV